MYGLGRGVKENQGPCGLGNIVHKVNDIIINVK